MIERAVLICNKEIISLDNFPEIICNKGIYSLPEDIEKNGLDMAVQEQNLLLAALDMCSWNQSRAAKKLGITRSALRYRLQKHGIKR